MPFRHFKQVDSFVHVKKEILFHWHREIKTGKGKPQTCHFL